MNKLSSVFLTGARILVIFTVGMSAAVVAEPKNGYSPIFTFDVMYEDSVVGEVKLNTAHPDPTYALVAEGLTPNTSYTFGYSIGQAGDMHLLGSEETSKSGSLRINGTIPLGDIEEVSHAPLEDIGDVPDDIALEFRVMETPPGEYYEEIVGLRLFNWGWVITQLQAYYSEDGGVTWQKSSSTDNILLPENEYADLGALGVPAGALVKIHAIVKAASDKTGSEVFSYTPYIPYWGENKTYAAYEIYGTAFKPGLQYWGLYEPGEQCP
jgi:hypothetical protein